MKNMGNTKYVIDMPYTVKCTKCSKNKLLKCQRKCTGSRLEKNNVLCPKTKKSDPCQCLEGKIKLGLCGDACSQKPEVGGSEKPQIASAKCDVSTKDWCEGDPYRTAKELDKMICQKWEQFEKSKENDPTGDGANCLTRMNKKFREHYRMAKKSMVDKADVKAVETRFIGCLEMIMNIELQRIEMSRCTEVSFFRRVVRWLCPCSSFPAGPKT